MGVGDGEGVAVGVCEGVVVGEGVGVGVEFTYKTSFEKVLSAPGLVYAVTAKKYEVPPVRFETVVVVEFPTSTICVYVWGATP